MPGQVQGDVHDRFVQKAAFLQRPSAEATGRIPKCGDPSSCSNPTLARLSSRSSPRLKSKAKPQVKPKAKGLFQDAELRVQSQARSTRRRVDASQLDSLTEMSWTVESVVTQRHCVMPHLNIDQSVARNLRSEQKHKTAVLWAESS